MYSYKKNYHGRRFPDSSSSRSSRWIFISQQAAGWLTGWGFKKTPAHERKCAKTIISSGSVFSSLLLQVAPYFIASRQLENRVKRGWETKPRTGQVFFRMTPSLQRGRKTPLSLHTWQLLSPTWWYKHKRQTRKHKKRRSERICLYSLPVFMPRRFIRGRWNMSPVQRRTQFAQPATPIYLNSTPIFFSFLW